MVVEGFLGGGFMALSLCHPRSGPDEAVDEVGPIFRFGYGGQHHGRWRWRFHGRDFTRDCVEIVALDGGGAERGVGVIRRWRWRGEGGGTVLLRGRGFVGEEHECGSDGGRGRGRE
uniref:Uncharacterized protein n=1 Tax=Fagus sylvatica TaxID=28930 RepID=A0A2N9ESG1_FAGSY